LGWIIIIIKLKSKSFTWIIHQGKTRASDVLHWLRKNKEGNHSFVYFEVV
jgi:hypothetical protein